MGAENEQRRSSIDDRFSVVSGTGSAGSLVSCTGGATFAPIDAPSRFRSACDRFWSFFASKSRWRQDLRRDVLRASAGPPPTPRVTIRPAVMEAAHNVQHRRSCDFMELVDCRTPALTIAKANELAKGLLQVPLAIRGQLTHGGLSRVFSTENENVVIKISDESLGLSTFELQGYGILKKHGLAAARVIASAKRDGFVILVLEKVAFTVASLIQSVAENGNRDDELDEVTTALLQLLANLRDSNVCYVDLSADNVCIRDDQSGEVVLIDPQFVTPFGLLAPKFDESTLLTLDAIHLALKIQAMGGEGASPEMRDAASTVSCGILGRSTPLDARMVDEWLHRDVSRNIRLAYDALKKNMVPDLNAPKEETSGTTLPPRP